MPSRCSATLSCKQQAISTGATISGTNGYGIRDSAGILQFKNSGGTWQSLQTVVNQLVAGGGQWSSSSAPYAGSDPDEGPALRWSDSTLANTLGLCVSGGLFYQGDDGNPHFYVRQYTNNGNPGNIVTRLAGDGATASFINASGGNIGIGTANPSWRLTVVGPASDWAEVVNWPPGSVNGYGILVGTGAGKYSQFQNAEGYYSQVAYSSYGLLTNGTIHTAGNIYSGSRGMWMSEAARYNGGQFWSGATCPYGSLVAGIGCNGAGDYCGSYTVLCQWIN